MKMQYVPMNVSQKCSRPRALVHHAAGHLWEPEIGSGENAEDCGHAHHHVEVADHEVGGVQ